MAQTKDTTIARLLAQAMPQAVTDPEKQLDLVRRAQAGDSKARNALIVGNMGLVVKWMSPYLTCARDVGLEAADLLTAGLYGPGYDGRSGVARAIDKFDPAKARRFSTYAFYWVQDAIWRELRNAGMVRLPDTRPREIPRFQTESIEEDTLGTTDDADAHDPETTARLDWLWAAAETELTPEERRIIQWRFGPSDMTPTAIARQLGVKRQQVQALERAALLKLRAAAEAAGLPQSAVA